MIDLRMILWFIMCASFGVWAFILVFRISKLWKQWLVYLGIWLSILIIQISTKHLAFPSWTILKQLPNNALATTGTLYNWFPSLLVVLIPISVFLIYKNFKRNHVQPKKEN